MESLGTRQDGRANSKRHGGRGVLLPPLTKVCDASRMPAMHRRFMAAEMSELFNLNFQFFKIAYNSFKRVSLWSFRKNQMTQWRVITPLKKSAEGTKLLL